MTNQIELFWLSETIIKFEKFFFSLLAIFTLPWIFGVALSRPRESDRTRVCAEKRKKKSAKTEIKLDQFAYTYDGLADYIFHFAFRCRRRDNFI